MNISLTQMRFKKPLPPFLSRGKYLLFASFLPSCPPRSASWHCGCLSSWSRSPTSTSSTAWCCVTWRRGTTWRTNHRRSGSHWRMASPTMPCKDLLLSCLLYMQFMEGFLLHKRTPVKIKSMCQRAVFFQIFTLLYYLCLKLVWFVWENSKWDHDKPLFKGWILTNTDLLCLFLWLWFMAKTLMRHSFFFVIC